jgi:ABC-2 type transport system permease protein
VSAFSQAIGDGFTLTKRNLLKNLRNPDIVVFSSAAPIAFALLFGFVFGSAITVHGSNYREFMMVGILTSGGPAAPTWTPTTRPPASTATQTMLLTASNTGVGIGP